MSQEVFERFKAASFNTQAFDTDKSTNREGKSMTEVRPLYLPLPYQEAADSGQVVLRDGSTASISIAGPESLGDLSAFFKRLSPKSRQRRFLSMTAPDPKLIESLCDSSDPHQKMTLIVTRVTEGRPRIIATGAYIRESDRTAEFAVAVDDAFNGKGLGTILLERLSVLAAMHGFTNLRTNTSEDNQHMLEVLRLSGFKLQEDREGPYANIDFSVLPSEESVHATEMRDRISTAVSLRPFFKPHSVAVIGASRNTTSIGYRIMEALIQNRFQGAVYPVNPNAKVVSSIRCYPSVKEIPEPVDLAVVVVPRDLVLPVVDDCAAGGVRALVVISAGFAEMNEEGRRLQEKLVKKARGYGMRLVGPNCLGLINTDPEFNLNASFSPIYPPAGHIAMYSQSGALGLSVLAQARRLNLGLSNFISVGNKADVTGNDLLQYWEEDEQTSVILIYLEAFKNPRRFARLARRLSQSKPIVCVKGGRSTSGQRAASSHTAALAGSDVPVEALFRQTGVIRSDTLQEMFEVAAALAYQPLPAGRRIGVVTNAGGLGILSADACEAGGLNLPEFSEEILGRLAEYLPAAASLANPVDMIASAPSEHYRQTVYNILISGEVDGLIVIYIPVGTADDQEVIKGIGEGVEAARTEGATDIPVLACPMFGLEDCPPLRTSQEIIPTYPFSESAARVMSKIADYADWRRQPQGVIQLFDDVQTDVARKICKDALKERGIGWLKTQETKNVLEAFKLPTLSSMVAHTADEAVEMARQIGFPVVLKLASHKIIHKTELDCVHLNLEDDNAVREAFEAIRDRLEQAGRLDAMDGALLQPMLSGSIEVMTGVTEDPIFGPLIAFGLGGVHVEIMGDVKFRVTPLTDRDADEMIREIRGYRLLQGYRGHSAADIDAIKEILLRISQLVEEVPEIYEMDLNPFFAREPGRGCRIVDARIRVEPATVEPLVHF